MKPVDNKMIMGVLDPNINICSFYPAPTVFVLQRILIAIGCSRPFTPDQIESIKTEMTEELHTSLAAFPMHKNYYYKGVLILEWHAKAAGVFTYKSPFKYE